MSDPTSKSRDRCPICGGPTDIAYRPFCSRRCGDVDLARWLRGAYVIPGPPEGGDEGEKDDKGDDVEDAAPSGGAGKTGGGTGDIGGDSGGKDDGEG